MADELKEFNQEEELKRKIRQKKRIRGCLIVANALLLCYFSYLVVDTVVRHVVEKNKIINSEIIQLYGKSSSKSKKIYEQYISNSIDVNDMATYGKYLLTSSSRVKYNDLHYENSVWLINLLSNPFVVKPENKLTFGDKIDEQLDLFSLDDGDYMICKNFSVSENKGMCYHYTGEKLLSKTIYSFPDQNNHRKQITIKGKASSPAIIISVQNINLLPKDYYDFVIIGDQSQFDAFQNTNYKVKYVDNLKDAYLTNSSYAINLIEQEGIYTSNYLSVDTTKSELIVGSSIYNNLDQDNAIRELGGYLFNAGYGVSETETNNSISKASLEIKSTNTEVRNGKYTLSVNTKTTLDQIIDIVN